MAFLTEEKLSQMGFKYIGKNVKISDKASIYNPANITIGNNVRIDDFCILSAGEGGIHLGRYVHIGCYGSLIGQGAIVLQEFAGLSGRVSIYSSSDDFSGYAMAHPTVPEKYRNVYTADVILEKHVLIGCGTVILPGVRIGEGAAVGAHSLVKSDCRPFIVYAGSPAKAIKERSKQLLDAEKLFLENIPDNY